MTLHMAKVHGNLQTHLAKGHPDRFWRIWWELLGLVGLLMPIILVHIGSICLLQLDWRRYLNEDNGFYRLSMEYGNVDNPDERIGQNIASFTHFSIKLTTSLLKDFLNITMSSMKLYAMSPTLFYILAAVSVIYTLVSIGCFAGPLIRIQRRVLAVEANLRYCLVRIRESGESVAFFRGYKYEYECCEKVLDYAIWAEYKKHAIEILFGLFKHVTEHAVELIPFVVVVPMYFNGTVEFGAIAQSHAYFKKSMSGMMDLGGELNNIAKLGAESVRLKELWDALRKISEEGKGASDAKSEASTATDSEDLSDIEALSSSDEMEKLHVEDLDSDLQSTLRIQVAELTLFPPLGDAPLMEGLSFSLHAGQSLLIEGPSGSGKSSLLRAIAGLWVSGHGTIRRTRLERCFFVPQTPYICLGSLHDNLLYPRREGVEEPSRKQLNIDHLPKRFGMDEEERQRLNLARLLLQPNVDLAILDESTSALDEANERTAYELVKNHVACFVSVGHRPGLVACFAPIWRHFRELRSEGLGRGLARDGLVELQATATYIIDQWGEQSVEFVSGWYKEFYQLRETGRAIVDLPANHGCSNGTEGSTGACQLPLHTLWISSLLPDTSDVHGGFCLFGYVAALSCLLTHMRGTIAGENERALRARMQNALGPERSLELLLESSPWNLSSANLGLEPPKAMLSPVDLEPWAWQPLPQASKMIQTAQEPPVFRLAVVGHHAGMSLEPAMVMAAALAELAEEEKLQIHFVGQYYSCELLGRCDQDALQDVFRQWMFDESVRQGLAATEPSPAVWPELRRAVAAEPALLEASAWVCTGIWPLCWMLQQLSQQPVFHYMVNWLVGEHTPPEWHVSLVAEAARAGGESIQSSKHHFCTAAWARLSVDISYLLGLKEYLGQILPALGRIGAGEGRP
ncbi:unnamed protein product [Symbiodinium sp. CCMP2592]|nr:unnamed protein product [Symbiodinium sp. CCMP2592]